MKIWRTAVGSGGHCNECGQPAPAFFVLDSGKRYCRVCVLDPAQNIAAIDRRGDELYGDAIARELDAQAAITLHLEVKEQMEKVQRCPGIDYGPPMELPFPLPDSYVHVLAVLEKLERADDEFATTIAELRERYELAACFSPKQMLLIQWRFSICNCAWHDPQNFAVSTRTDAEKQQMWSFDDWRKKKIAPYLSWQQRNRFGV